MRSLFLLCGLGAALSAQTIDQKDLLKDPAVVLDTPAAVQALTTITQHGKLKGYEHTDRELGVVVRTGAAVDATFTLQPRNGQSPTLLHIDGAGTHLRWSGVWDGDGNGAFPQVRITNGAHLTFTQDLHVDLVMAESYFTRQIWAWGDGTGTLELAAGFDAERTQSATVPDACGTIRLAGLTMITHHSDSLPYNWRPDGRGGIYANGHVVFEGETPSIWRVASNAQVYPAQIDFRTDGSIDCQAALTHTGQRRDCLQVGPGGIFRSSGAFRTIGAGITITKTGPAMLSLDGQQGYYPDARLVVAEGLVRMHSDPAAGNFYDEQAGNNLHLEVAEGGRALLSAPLIRLRALTVAAGGHLEIAEGCRVEVAESVDIAEGATVDGHERLVTP